MSDSDSSDSSNTSNPRKQPPVDLDDPATLTDHDFARMHGHGLYQYKPYDLETDLKDVISKSFQEHLKVSREYLDYVYFLAHRPDKPVTDEVSGEYLRKFLGIHFFSMDLNTDGGLGMSFRDKYLPYDEIMKAMTDEHNSRDPRNITCMLAMAMRYYHYKSFDKALDMAKTALDNSCKLNICPPLILTSMKNDNQTDFPHSKHVHISAYYLWLKLDRAMRRQRRFFESVFNIEIFENCNEMTSYGNEKVHEIMYIQGMMKYFDKPFIEHALHIRKNLINFMVEEVDEEYGENVKLLLWRYITLLTLCDKTEFPYIERELRDSHQLHLYLDYAKNLDDVKEHIEKERHEDTFDLDAFMKRKLPCDEGDEQKDVTSKENHPEQQQSTLPSNQSNIPAVDLDDPNTMIDEDFVNLCQLHLYPVDFVEVPKALEQVHLMLSNGQFWEAHKVASECLEITSYECDCRLNDLSFHGHHLRSFLNGLFYTLEVERAKRITRGEKNAVLPRQLHDRQEAEQMAAEAKRNGRQKDGTSYFIYAFAYRFIRHGHYASAINIMCRYMEITNARRQIDPNSVPPVNQIRELLSLAFNLYSRELQFKLIQHILEREGEEALMETDPIVRKIFNEKGFEAYFNLPLMDHAHHIHKYLIRFLEMRDQGRALKLCKRYFSLQQCYGGSEWPDLGKKMEQTKALLNELQYGSIDRVFHNGEQSVRVSVAIGGYSNSPHKAPCDVVFDYERFKKDQLPRDENVSVIKRNGCHANYSLAEDVKPICCECEKCGEIMATVPKRVPSTCYTTGLVISGVLTPCIIGIVPLAVLLATKPCHDVHHYCSECSAEIETL